MSNNANAAIISWYGEKHAKIMAEEIYRFDEVFQQHADWREVLLRLVQSDAVNSLLSGREGIAAEYRYRYDIYELIDKISFARTFVGHEIMDDGDPFIIHMPYRGDLWPVMLRFNPELSNYITERITEPKQVLYALDWHETLQARKDKMLRREPHKHENSELIEAFVNSYKERKGKN